MWTCRCRIQCGIVGFDCPSCDLCRPVPGCLSAHSLAPTRAVVWLSGHETVGQTLLFLHMHLFLHLHLLPCCQPLIDLFGLACLDLDALAAGMLACWLGSPGLKLGLSGSLSLCCTMRISEVVGRIFNHRGASQMLPTWYQSFAYVISSIQSQPFSPKTPNPFQIGLCSRPILSNPASPWKFRATRFS